VHPIGGLLGLALGYAAVRMLSSALGWPVEFNSIMTLAAVATSSAIGILCGILPAERAARVDPAILLRGSR